MPTNGINQISGCLGRKGGDGDNRRVGLRRGRRKFRAVMDVLSTLVVEMVLYTYVTTFLTAHFEYVQLYKIYKYVQ